MREPFTEVSDALLEMRLPLQERVVDKLADMLFASDMILDMLHGERSCDFSKHLTSVEPSVRRVYDQINELMKQLTD
ncbi:MAG: hypothetical protein M3P29_13630 [Acidobacteriota bacterium]|nr:hypothetical protein [Acidobacteriota bacterium]